MKKTALITGASSGIGLEFAYIFASKGVNLVLVDQSKEKLDAVKLQIGKQHGVIIFNIGKDLSASNVAIEVYNELKSKKIHIDYLINSVGFSDFGYFAESDWNKQLQMINVNITFLTYLTRLFLPEMMKEKFGKILNIASIASFHPGPTMSVYFATKSYVLSFSEAIAHEVKGTGVSVTVLCLGAIESEFGQKATLKEVGMYGYQKMMRGKTVVVVHGFVNKLLTQSIRFVPRDFVTSIVKMNIKAKL